MAVPPVERALDDPSTPVEEPVGLPSIRPGAYVSDLVIDVLRALGCRYVPLNPGSSFRGLHDSLVNHGGNRDPQLLLCLHEEIAVSLAHAYAKATGEVAVVAVHDLVGLMHASMAVYDAWCDRTPLLLLGGGGPATSTARRPIDWLHSAATQAELVRDYVKWNDEPADAQALVDGVVRGHALAATAPTGPVYVTLDADLQEQPAGNVRVPDLTRHRPPRGPAAAHSAVRAAAAQLARARMPLIVAGRVGIHPAASRPLVALAELLGAACIDERHAVAFPTDHPLNLNGDAMVVRDADVILAVDVTDLRNVLGATSTRDRGVGEGTVPAGTTVVELSLGALTPSSWSHAWQAPAPVDIALLADSLVGLEQLLAETRAVLSEEAPAQDQARLRRRDELAARHGELRARQRRGVESRLDDVPLSPARLVADLWQTIKDRQWLLVLRNTRSWPEGVWKFTGGGQYLGHSGGAGVGYGPGAMVGGALAARDRGELPVGIIGDGDLLMAPGALWTAVHYRIPLLAVVNNNRSFYNDEGHQLEMARRRDRPLDNSWIGMRLDDPPVDLAAMARSFGAWAEGPVTRPDQLSGALARALGAVDQGQVAMVDVHTAPA